MAKFLFPVNALRSGEFFESDLFVEKDFFLRQGHKVTPELLIKLKKQGIKELATRLEPLAARMRERMAALTDGDRVALAEGRDELLCELGVKPVIPRERYDEAVAVVARSFHDVADGTLDNFGDLWQTAEMIAETAVYTGAELLKPLDVANPEEYYSYHTVNLTMLMAGVFSSVCSAVGRVNAAMGCLMHDLGKAFVPPDVLFKRGALTPEEYGLIKNHINHSTQLIGECGEVHEHVRGMVSGHHEKFNGTGYPDGLAGEEIPYLARWLTACDVYDALTTSRSYQSRIAPPIALELISQSSGSHFDPDCTRKMKERLGSYPVGSYLLLEGNRIALVTRVFPEENQYEAEAAIVSLAGGTPKPDGKIKISGQSEVIDTIDI